MMLFAPVVLPFAKTSANVSTVATCASTYALMLCWVAKAVALSEAILSSSRIFVTVVAPVPFKDATVTNPVDVTAPAVIVPAAKLPEASRKTIVEAVLSDRSTIREAENSTNNTPLVLFCRNT